MTIRSSLMLLALLIFLSFLQYRLWFQAGGIQDTQVLKKKIAEQAALNEELKEKNKDLLFQINRLQTSQDALEARARNELGMIKKGETYYQIVKPQKSTVG